MVTRDVHERSCGLEALRAEADKLWAEDDPDMNNVMDMEIDIDWGERAVAVGMRLQARLAEHCRVLTSLLRRLELQGSLGSTSLVRDPLSRIILPPPSSSSSSSTNRELIFERLPSASKRSRENDGNANDIPGPLPRGSSIVNPIEVDEDAD